MDRSGAAALVAGVMLVAATANAAFVREPWIQDATKSSVTIAWEAGAAGGTQTLVYGAGAALDKSVPGTLVSDKLYTATVSELAPSSAFSYKVLSGADESPAGSFVTAPAMAEPFRFGVTGDNRSSPSGHASVVAATIPLAPDFMLNTGDIVDGTDYVEFFGVEKELLRNAAIFPCPGNHDAASQYQYGFHRPNWYSFRWGNAFFLSINSDGDYSAGSAQLAWVEQQLQAAKADPTIGWIFPYHHHPVYSSGSHGSTQAVIDRLNPLYVQYGVDVVFNAHDHNYERIEKDGVVYIVTGGGGVSPRSMGAPVDGAVISESTRHVTIVDVDGGVLKLVAYRPDGTILDQREIVKGPPSGTGGDPGDPGDAGDPGHPGGPSAPGGGMETIHGGCACAIGAAPGASAGGPASLALLLAGLAAVRRRKG